ncbi:hypothetical protein NFI96_021563 [Prochilodus magdalenae]|nr:hypothetical protein NFI96_021563 [Prochilodus magdalenae]
MSLATSGRVTHRHAGSTAARAVCVLVACRGINAYGHIRGPSEELGINTGNPGNRQQPPPARMTDQSNIQSAACKSIRPFKSSEEYLYAMKEDLAEWLHALYGLDITVDTFMESLETGCALCEHANNVNRAARLVQPRRPWHDVAYQARGAAPGSFVARDNVSNFIAWCRGELRVKDVLMFETNDLVERGSEKNFVLCLLEVARRGARFGVPAPVLVQLEEEIAREESSERERERERVEGTAAAAHGGHGHGHGHRHKRQAKQENEEEEDEEEHELAPIWQPQRRVCDMRNLDELVREILGQCSCPAQFPMTKVSDGKYKVGDSSALIFIRIRPSVQQSNYPAGRVLWARVLWKESCGAESCGAESCGQSPMDQSPVGQSPVGQSPVGQSPVGQSPVGRVLWAEPCGAESCGAESCGQSPVGRALWGRVLWGRVLWAESYGPESCGAESCGAESCGAEFYGPESCGAESCGQSPVGQSPVGRVPWAASRVHLFPSRGGLMLPTDHVQVLRTHVMVRVGGGWDTLEHYLDKHDPCRCNAFAHRYQQAKASGPAPHSKNSSAHSSRSTSPGPHWRGESMAAYKSPDRRSLEPSSACTASSSSRPGRTHHTATDPDPGRTAAATLLPRPPRDRSEPRLNPLRSKDSLLPLARRLSGDSDSSTASSKGGSGGAGGGRFSMGARRSNGEEVVLLVNRKEGKHVIERPEGGSQIPSLRPPQTRARSVSRERPAPPSSMHKPSPPQGPAEGHRAARPERGRSLGPEGQRRLQGPRSLSQGKTPLRGRVSDASPVSPRHRDPQPKDDLRSKQVPPGSPRLSGGLSKRQTSSSVSNSPVKGSSGTNSPVKKGVVTPRPPAPRSPSVGSRRLLPPVSQPGRRSPHSSNKSPHHHPPRSPRVAHSPRATGRPQRGWAHQQSQEPQEDEMGLGFGFQPLSAQDAAQREMELYRSFEAEFLANTQQQAQAGQTKASATKEVGTLLPVTYQQGFGVLGDTNVTDSAYSSSNSSSSSLNVGGKLPDLRESKRTRNCALEDPPALLHSQTRIGLPNGGLRERERWTGLGGGLRKLPAISSSMEEGEPVRESDLKLPCVPQQVNGGHLGLPPAEVPMDSQPDWAEVEGDVPLDDHHSNLPYDHEDANANTNNDLPLPPPPEDCSYNDSSSESSSMCFSLSEPLSDGSCTPPPPPMPNGDTENTVVLRAKKGQKKAERVPSIYKLKLRPRIRPRTDNRPENSPSRIPTPVSYRDQHHRQHQSPANLSPLQTPPQSPRPHGPSRKAMHQAFADLIHPQQRSPTMGSRERSFSPASSLDGEAWM